jgi:cell division protein FtsW (lipid II flippase)
MIYMENNFILLLFVLAIFSISAIFRQNFRSFQITIILFILLMIFGEMVISFTDKNDSNTNKAMELKVQIQFVAMLFLLTVVWFRYYRILKSRRKPVETLDSMLK